MKEFTWNIQLDGTEHHLLAVRDKRGSGYHLYDGDDYITNILPATFWGTKMGIEQKFEVDGHTMRFCQWKSNTAPDIELDGRMVWSNEPYAKAKEKVCRWRLIQCALILVLLCVPVQSLITQTPLEISECIVVFPFVVYYIYKTVKFARLEMRLNRMKGTNR